MITYCFCLTMAVAQSSAGQTPAPTPANAAQTGAQIGAYIARQEWRQAQDVLESLPPEALETPEVMFVRAFLARRLKRYDEAIELYQRLLDRDAGLLRVRLELADTFFESGDDRAAERNYRLALASDAVLPARARIEAQLKAIAEHRRWRYSVSLAVAPDSNVNAATGARETEIFGLPFELSDDARRTSGVSLNVGASAERSTPLRGSSRLTFTGWGQFTDNEGTIYDDASLGFSLGPQVWLGDVQVEVRATVNRRWFGGDPLSRGAGAVTTAQWGWGRTQRRATVSAQRLDYDVGQARDAWLYGAGVEQTRFVNPNRFWKLTGSTTRGAAEDASESFWQARLSAGVYQALPAGLAVWAEPSIERRVYDAHGVFAATPRRDTELGLAVRVVKRDWRYRGFSPYVGVLKSHNRSNIDLNDFSRLKIEFGASRTF